jgi:hypothetical protein
MKKQKPIKRASASLGKGKHAFECLGGPMNHEVLYLSDGCTLPFVMKGQAGRYAYGKWEAAK